MRTVIFLSLLFALSISSFGQYRLNKQLFDYANNSPLNADIDELLEYLKAGAKSKKELAELTAYWVVQNIEYDTKAFVSNTYSSPDWETTFLSGKAVCSGYAQLYKELCDRIDIYCKVVSGYAKGYGYSPGDSVNQFNHAWNIIEIDGKFLQMDLTWASGYVHLINDKLKFFRLFKPEVLFANPKEFVIDHLPGQKKWQLLNYPISTKRFSSYQSFEQMSDSSSRFYNYKDSIKLYLELEFIDQQIKDAEESYSIIASEVDLANSYEYIAYQLSVKPKEKSQLTKSRYYYSKAQELYELMQEKKGTERCEIGLNYVDYYLRSM